MYTRIPASINKPCFDVLKKNFGSEIAENLVIGMQKMLFDDYKLDISAYGMKEIYEFLIQHPELLEILPAQIIVVQQMPIWLDEESRSKSCVFICEDKDYAKTGLCLLLNNGHVTETLHDILEGNSTVEIPVLEVPYIKDYVHIVLSKRNPTAGDKYDTTALDTRITAKRLLSIYQFALSVADRLRIPVPLILCTDMEMPCVKGKTPFCRYAYGKKIYPIVQLAFHGLNIMKFNLVHEFRHIWQAHNTHYLEEKIEYTINDPRYFCDPYEVDANAYACIYCSSIGFSNPLILWAETKENLEECRDNPDYLLINARIRELQSRLA